MDWRRIREEDGRHSGQDNFGKVSVNKFTYCGREVLKDEREVHITCPSLMDRVRTIHDSSDA